MFEGKNGVEIEIEVKDTNFMNRNNEATDIFADRISSSFYYDDGKPEYPSNPYNYLGDLEEDIRFTISHVCELAKRQDWYILLLGTDPLSADRFASSHIHQSMSNKPKKKEIDYMREHLAGIQHFIALLGQNSSIIDNKITNCKDARLGYSVWSEFTPYDTDSFSHYLSLASGLGGGRSNVATLEIRIPSSTPLLEQILGNVILVRSVCSLPEVPILPLSETKKLYYRVIRYGGDAIVPILKPNGIGYLGVKGKKVYVKVSELFKLLLKDDLLKEKISECLDQLTRIERKRVLEFYDTICKGYTISDYIESTYLSVGNTETLIEILNNTVYDSYSKGESFKETLVEPRYEKEYLIEDKISLEEINNMILKCNTDFTNSNTVEETDKIVRELREYILKYPITKTLLQTLYLNWKDHKDKIPSKVLDFLIDNKILDSNLKKSSKFNIIYQLAKEQNIL